MLNVKGLGKILIDIEKLKKETFDVALAELGAITDDIKTESLNRVHVDSGALKSSVFVRDLETGFAVGYSAPYAAFEEFGTGALVDVPNGFDDLAMQFKGSGIRQRNGTPHPYLFPAYFMYSDGAVKRIEDALKSKITILK